MGGGVRGKQASEFNSIRNYKENYTFILTLSLSYSTFYESLLQLLFPLLACVEALWNFFCEYFFYKVSRLLISM